MLKLQITLITSFNDLQYECALHFNIIFAFGNLKTNGSIYFSKAHIHLPANLVYYRKFTNIQVNNQLKLTFSSEHAISCLHTLHKEIRYLITLHNN